MASIKVHTLLFYGPWSHIEILLENNSTTPAEYYHVNRWVRPNDTGWYVHPNAKTPIDEADAHYSFDIEAEPSDIHQVWHDYWHSTAREASILSNNCADAAQWFLTHFANIPAPGPCNISLNHLAFGIFWWPSFIPCPISLPGRIMDNAQFHAEARKNPNAAEQYSHLYLRMVLGVSALLIAASITGIVLAATIMSGGIAAGIIAGCVVAGATSSYAFFQSYNHLSAKDIEPADKTNELIIT